MTKTLLADESAVYDPREPNDRLLLGVKGTLIGSRVDDDPLPDARRAVEQGQAWRTGRISPRRVCSRPRP